MDMKDQDEMPLTKGDIKALFSMLATKADLNLLATKEDLTLLVTKEDAKSFATKEDLKAVGRRLSIDIVRTHDRIDRLRVELRGEMAIKTSNVFNKIDGFMAQVGKIDRAQVIADWRVAQLEKRIDSIETRPS